jgi:hypothetical protein
MQLCASDHWGYFAGYAYHGVCIDLSLGSGTQFPTFSSMADESPYFRPVLAQLAKR